MAMKVALIGAGMIGVLHARVLSRMPDVEIAAIVDLDLQRATKVADEFGGTAAANISDVLPLIDAGYVLTPPRGRLEVIRTLAKAGKSIFCEKPMAATVAEGEEIQRVVRTSGIPFMMGFMRRYAPTMVRVKEILRSGALGEITQVSYQRLGTAVPPAGNWRIDPAALCGMTVESVSHDIDLLRWLIGDIAQATGHVINTSGLAGYDDNMVANLKFANGAAASLQASWTSRLAWNSIGIVGKSGALMIDGSGTFCFDRVRVIGENGTQQDIVIDRDEASDLGMVGENEAFISALKSGRHADYPGVDDGLATLIVSLDITESYGGVVNRP